MCILAATVRGGACSEVEVSLFASCVAATGGTADSLENHFLGLGRLTVRPLFLAQMYDLTGSAQYSGNAGGRTGLALVFGFCPSRPSHVVRASGTWVLTWSH